MLYYKYMEEQNIADEYKVRLSKLNKLKKDGYTPYKKNFKITHFIGDIKELDVNDFRDKELVLKKPKDFCSVAGRVITIRNHGKIIFMDVSDTKGTVQVAIKNDCIDKKSLDFFNEFIDPGDFVGISGEPFLTNKGVLSILVSEISLL